MFVINPDSFLMPCYRISPFTTEHIASNNELSTNDFAIAYFNKKFGKGNWQFTYNGRGAIKLAIETYNLAPTDLITILTTSNNFYISSCVTKEIEKVCRWNREILPETKIIFVNHEFGYPFPDMDTLVATGLPIIEDCCTTFFSQDANEKIGQYGDFSVYSFPKFFPIQIGGLLVKNVDVVIEKSVLNKEESNYIENVLSYHLANAKDLLQKRKVIFDYAQEQFSNLGFTLRFNTSEKVVPSLLLLNNNSIIHDLNALKLFLTNNGIQSSVFYGEDAFFIPNHQNLAITQIKYFFEVIKFYLENNNE
ncbi:DegT/DnrJ/EryC1/StrS family aminotransferase [Flavobacterium paronense]|uniref:DegT/DnrJ/EryC1/StrS family aminotransferase n=1 Tax=Flavobacterium paronense TaxID=1392775 RepID=A0ABV5GAL6_9FLAO|nr:DegT/DnrJ/EryC1/StrS family aminotransferase [Flavobacterium paronense]MDN3676665.1 DegT/DnrJ/EryC1/StrS family aminotransferase [Flavobacterium paronense]